VHKHSWLKHAAWKALFLVWKLVLRCARQLHTSTQLV